jgi:hypothetical protein
LIDSRVHELWRSGGDGGKILNEVDNETEMGIILDGGELCDKVFPSYFPSR